MPTVINGSSNINLDATTGGRITGDFSNATIANRVMFQNSVTNAVTAVGAIPNGTATTARFQTFGSSDPSNSSVFTFAMENNGEARLNASATGTGINAPMTFYTGGSERVRIDTSGRLLVGTASQIGTSAASLQVLQAANPALTLGTSTTPAFAGVSIGGVDAWAFDGST